MQNLLIKCDFSVRIKRILHSCFCIIEFIKLVGENGWCSANPCILSFPPTCLIDSIIHEHLGKILYLMHNVITRSDATSYDKHLECQPICSDMGILTYLLIIVYLQSFKSQECPISTRQGRVKSLKHYMYVFYFQYHYTGSSEFLSW